MRPSGMKEPVYWLLLLAIIGLPSSDGQTMPSDTGYSVCPLDQSRVLSTITSASRVTADSLQRLCVPGEEVQLQEDAKEILSRIMPMLALNISEVFEDEPIFKDLHSVKKISLAEFLGPSSNSSRHTGSSKSLHMVTSPNVIGRPVNEDFFIKNGSLSALLLSIRSQFLPVVLKKALTSGIVSNQAEYWLVLQSTRPTVIHLFALSPEVSGTSATKYFKKAAIIHKKSESGGSSAKIRRRKRTVDITINRYPQVFDVDLFVGNPNDYSDFVETLRQLFSENKYHDTHIGKQDNGLTSVRFMSSERKPHLLTELIYRHSDLYVVGFIVQHRNARNIIENNAYFDKEFPLDRFTLSDGIRLESNGLPMSFNYNDLQKKGEMNLQTHSLSFDDPPSLLEPMATYHHDVRGNIVKPLSRSLFRLVVMTSEAIRFQPVQRAIQQAFEYYHGITLSENFLNYVDTPNHAMIYPEFSLLWLLRNWEGFSSQMRNIYENSETVLSARDKHLAIKPNELGEILSLAKGSCYAPSSSRVRRAADCNPTYEEKRIDESHTFIELPDETLESRKESLVGHLMKGSHYARILQVEIPKIMHRRLLDSNWIPDFHGAVELDSGAWSLPFIHKEDKVIQQVEIHSADLRKALQFLKMQGRNIQGAFDVEGTTIKRKTGISENIHASGQEGLNVIGIIQMLVRTARNRQEVDHRFATPITQGLQVFAWVNAGQNFAQAMVDIVHTTLSAASEGSAITESLLAASTVSKGLGGLGYGLSFVAIGIDGYELYDGIKRDDVSSIAVSATALVFDGIFTGMATVAAVGGALAGSVVGILAVPLAGVAIGITALVRHFSGNLQKALNAMHFLGNIYHSYDIGGYELQPNGVLIPQYALITMINYSSETVTFGETLIRKNTWYLLNAPKYKEGYLDLRTAFGLPSTANFDKSAKLLVLPYMGRVKLTWDTTYTSTALGWRNDWEMVELKKLYYRSGKQFTFYNGFHGICDIEQCFDDTTVKVILDQHEHHLFMPQSKHYPDANAKLKHKTWEMIYSIIGSGGNYVLTVNNKQNGAVRVHLSEQDTSGAQSKWILIAGEDISDDITDVSSQGEYGPSFRLGGIFIGIRDVNRTVVMISKRNGELWVCNMVSGSAELVGVEPSWMKKHNPGDINIDLERLASERHANHLLLTDFTAYNSHNAKINHLSGIYFSDTHKIQAEDREGLTYRTNFSVPNNGSGIHVQFNGVNALTWMTKHNGTNLLDQLSKVAEKKHKETIDVSGLQGFDQQHNIISGTYYLHTETLIEISDKGKIYEVSQNNPITLIGLSPLWTMSQGPLNDDFATKIRSALVNETVSSIIPVYGVYQNDTNEEDAAKSPHMEVPTWYDVENKLLTCVAGLPGYSLEYVGLKDGIIWLFDYKHGTLFAQIAISDHNMNVTAVTPDIYRPYQELGNLSRVSVVDRKIMATNIEDMTFELRGLTKAVLKSVGQHCNQTWEEIHDNVEKGYYGVAEVLTHYGPINAKNISRDEYWYHFASQKAFRPIDNDAISMSMNDFVYVAYSSFESGGIFLFNKEHHMLYFLNATSLSLFMAADDIFRAGDVIGIVGASRLLDDDIEVWNAGRPVVADAMTALMFRPQSQVRMSSGRLNGLVGVNKIMIMKRGDTAARTLIYTRDGGFQPQTDRVIHGRHPPTHGFSIPGQGTQPNVVGFDWRPPRHGFSTPGQGRQPNVVGFDWRPPTHGFSTPGQGTQSNVVGFGWRPPRHEFIITPGQGK